MRVYADTSVLVAWFHPMDEFAIPVTKWCRECGPEFFWNLLLRVELRHHLRRLKTNYAAQAWHAYRASETSFRLRLGKDRSSDLLELGDELSARHVEIGGVGSWDCVHVAAALHDKAEVFATCDHAQAVLARSAGLSAVKLFGRSRGYPVARVAD